MGRELTRAMKRMSWKTKASITLLLAVLLMAGLFQGLYKPLSSQAAITPQQNWGVPLYNANANPGNLSFTVNNGADRVLVVAVSSTIAAVSTTQTCTVSFGGVSLTEAVSDKTVSSRQHTWLFYLKDTPSVMDGTAKTLAVTVGNGGQTLRHNAVYAAVFAGVDQTTPVADFKSYNSGTGTTTAPAFATALTENTGDQPVVVMNAVRVNKTAGAAIAAAANWTLVQSALYANTDGHRTGVLNRAIPTSNTSDTAAGTTTQACLTSMAGISLKTKPTIPILSASGNTAIATGSRLDTDTGVLMQRIQVQGDGSIVLNSITMDNPGTANNIALADIYISGSAQTVLPVGAVLIGSVSSWSGTSTQIPLDQGTVADRTAGITPKYIYIVYDMSMGQATKTVGSHITGIGVVGPSSSLTGLNMSSNLITLDMANNSLSTSLNTPVAVSPRKDSDVDVMMQHFQVASDAIGDGAIELNSLTIEDLGTAPQVSGVKVYVDTVEQATLSENAKLVGVLSEWNKASTVIPLNDDYGASASDRTVIAGTPKYIYVLYDMYYADAYSPISVQSKVTAVGASSPDAGASGLSYTSNLINLNRGTWSKITSCGGCHDTQNITDGTARNVPDGKFIGSHYKHTNYLGKDCDICHQKPPVTKYNHASGFIDFTGNVGRNYSKGKSFRVSNAPVMGTCSNISCHSSGQSTTGGATPEYTPIAWSSTVDCGSCHLNMDTNGSAPGEHVMHAQIYPISCATCHNGYTETTVNTATHVNNVIELSFSGNATGTTYSQGDGPVGNNYGTCSTSYCHSTGQSSTGGATPTYPGTPPTWGTTVTNCASCHLNFDTNGSAPGDHVKHAQGTANFACATCHNGNTETTVNTATHVNKVINLSFSGTYGTGTTYSQGSSAAGDGYGNCSTSKCHGQGAPVWGGALYSATVQCENCHGSAATSPFYSTAASGANPTKVTAETDGKVGAHLAHLTARAGYINAVACTECHAAVGSLTAAGHLDGSSTPTFSGKAVLNSANPSYATGTCSNTYCHGGKMLNGSTNGTDITPTWTQTAYLTGTPSKTGDCAMCHGCPPTGYTGNSHSGSEVLADCNGCHGHVTTAGTFTAGANRTLHLNGVVEAAGGTCIGCHSALVTADFVRPSRHVSNGTTTSIVTNFDCIVCHAEGDPTSNGTTIGRTSLHTGNASGKIDLRNVDNSVTTANVGAAGTNYWAWDGRRANLLPKGATYTSQRDNMDTFCLNCHDDNGSSTIAVNNSNSGLLLGTTNVNVVRTVTGTGNANTNSASAAQRPFNTNDQLKNVNDTGTGGNGAVLGTYRLTTYGRVLNVKSQFNSGNVNGTNWASHHNLNQYTKRYTTNNTTAGTGLATTVWTAYVNKEGKTMNGTGAGTGANAGLHCSDCHLNEVNAHGSSASWYMLAGPNIAADDDVAPTLSGTAGTGSSISCFRCHAPAEYAVGGGGSAGRVDHDGRCNNVDAVTGTAVEAPFGNSCHGCHGGFGDTAQAVNKDTRGTGSLTTGRGPLGAIHGNNETYTPGGGSSTKRYRFMSGASMRFWNPAGAATTNWTASTTSGNNCYTLSGADQWGSCTKHSGGAPQTINSGRSLTY